MVTDAEETSPSCYGGNDGSLTLSANNGAYPYSFSVRSLFHSFSLLLKSDCRLIMELFNQVAFFQIWLLVLPIIIISFC